jgi:hypothetical protein
MSYPSLFPYVPCPYGHEQKEGGQPSQRVLNPKDDVAHQVVADGRLDIATQPP